MVISTPIASPNFVIVPTTDTLAIAVSNAALGAAVQNQKSVPMLRMELKTQPGENTAILNSIKFDLIGSGVDSDVSNIKIWRDVGNDGVENDTGSVKGEYPNLLSAGNDFFNQRTSLVRFSQGVVISSNPTILYATVDVSEFAQVRKSIGLSVGGTDYFTVAIPDGKVPAGPFPANSALNFTDEARSVITMGVNDICAMGQAVSQGQTKVPVLRFNMKTDTSQGTWRKLMVERTGVSSEQTKNNGRNRDVKFVRIMLDINSNDRLDLEDIPVSGRKTALASGFTSATPVPFDLLVASTEGFPSSGDIFISDVELMHYVSISTFMPALRIDSRSNILGVAATPALTALPGAVVEKVDLFDQVDDNSRTRLIELSYPQIISPSQQTYFLVYDIGDGARIGNGVGVNIPGPNAIVIDQPPDVVNGRVNIGVTQSPMVPDGTTSQNLPWATTKVLIGGTVLKVSGNNLAPAAVEPGTKDITFMRLEFQTNQGFVDLGAMRLKQTGTKYCVSASACDLISVSLYLDTDNNNAYSAGDTLIGKTLHSYQAGGSADFELGVATISIASEGLPRLRIGSTRSVMFVLGTVGSSDAVIGHSVGLTLESYGDLKAPGGLVGLSAVPDPDNMPPVSSSLLDIAPLVVPVVAISTNTVPVITTLAGLGVPSVAVGYPAYALVSTQTSIIVNGVTYNCNNGKNPAFMRNNMCKDGTNNYVPDQTRWICADGSKWLENCPQDPPLLDINGDNVPDNFSTGSDTRLNRVSLTGDGIPSRDMVGNRALEMDLNQDGIPDQVIITGSGGRQMMLGTDALEPSQLLPVPDLGFVPSAWVGTGQSLKAVLPAVSAEGYYEVAAGQFYDEPESLSGTWRRVEASAAAVKEGARAKAFSVMAAGAPLTAATITGLALPVPNYARLTQNIGISDTRFTVDDSSKLKLPGMVYVGSEVMRVERAPGDLNTLVVMPSSGTMDSGRGLRGSTPIAHLGSLLGGEPVSDGGAVFSARFVSVSGSTATVSTIRPMFVFRFDPNIPTVPGVPKPQIPPGALWTTYEIKWDPSIQKISGVAGYEIQERGGEVSDLQANVVWRPMGFVASASPSYFVGSSAFPGEAPRPQSQFYFYRARAMSNAGVFSPWSTLDIPVTTGETPAAILSNVRNYPNPFDPRKGGMEGKTAITYTLADNAEVTITLYDLMGYVVREFRYSSGSEGGKPGPNIVLWDGKNGMGGFVSKGGYIVRIKAAGSKGTKVILRKVGVIH